MSDAASTQLRLMAVHAHPDDESSKGAATMAKYASEGVIVRVVTCTGGERGDILNPKLVDDPEVIANLPAIRKQEMAKAAHILGIEQRWLGFVDSGLPEGDPLPPLPDGCFGLEPLDMTTAALVRQIREFRPQVLTTYDETGGYPHPDHVMCHVVSMAAVEAAADPQRYPDAGQPWRVPKVYYNQTFSKERILAVHEACLARGIESPFADWIEAWPAEQWPQRPISAKIECSAFFDQRDDALRAHATQIDPDGFFFAIPRELEVEVWPWETYELVSSSVSVDDVESDLFAGLR